MQYDPVCAMEVDSGEAIDHGLVSEVSGRRYYFCSESCKQEFDRNPRPYLESGEWEQENPPGMGEDYDV